MKRRVIVERVIVLSLEWPPFFLVMIGVVGKHTPKAAGRLVSRLKRLATPAGFEPATFSLEGRRKRWTSTDIDSHDRQSPLKIPEIAHIPSVRKEHGRT